jgi:hypothetical protein
MSLLPERTFSSIEDEGRDTTDTGDETDQIFDPDNKDEFNPRIDGNDIYADVNIDWSNRWFRVDSRSVVR